MKVQSESLITAHLYVTECFIFFACGWHWGVISQTDTDINLSVCPSSDSHHIHTDGIHFLVSFEWLCFAMIMYVKRVSAGILFSWSVFLHDQYSAVEARVWKMLILVGPHRVCIWGCVRVWMLRFTRRVRNTALLSIRSPFCTEMIQYDSLGSYWSCRRLKEVDSIRRESLCNTFRHLLDVRNTGFDVTGNCQRFSGEPGKILWPCVVRVWEFVRLYRSWFLKSAACHMLLQSHETHHQCEITWNASSIGL